MPESEPPYPHDLESLPPELGELSPSCENIYRIIATAEEPLTHRDICDRTVACSDYSVRNALRRLRDEADLLTEHTTGDARQSAYSV